MSSHVEDLLLPFVYFWMNCVGQIKKISVFRVTRPYLNLLVKPRLFSDFLKKKKIICILKGEMPFKMYKIIFFFPPQKMIEKICLPTLPKIFRPVT